MASWPACFYFRGRVASRTSPVLAEQVRLVLRAVKSRRLDLVSCSGWEPEPELPVAPVAGIEKFQGSVWRPGIITGHRDAWLARSTRQQPPFPPTTICCNLSRANSH